MLGRSLALEVSKPDFLGEDRSSGAPGDTDASPARSLDSVQQSQANAHTGGRHSSPRL